MEKKKKIIWSLIALLLAVLTIFAVLSQSKDLSVPKLLSALQGADPGWLILALLGMVGFIFFEGQAILCMLKHINYKRPQLRGFLYAASDAYFSAITPSATGGQPASAFFMMFDGVPGAIVTVTLLMNLIMYTLAVLLIGLIGIVISPNIFFQFHLPAKILILAGIAILLFLAFLFYMLLQKREILYRIASRFYRFLYRIHLIRHLDIHMEKLQRSMVQYGECVQIMSGHAPMLVRAFLFNILQRASQIFVTIATYMATGGSFDKVADLWVVQTFVAIGSNCVPIPGAMGVADYLMIDGFGILFSEREFILQLEILSRGLSFYCCILVSGLTVAIAYLRMHKHH